MPHFIKPLVCVDCTEIVPGHSISCSGDVCTSSSPLNMLWFHEPDWTLTIYYSEHATAATENHLLEPQHYNLPGGESMCVFVIVLSEGRDRVGFGCCLIGDDLLFLLSLAACSYSSALVFIKVPRQTNVTKKL